MTYHYTEPRKDCIRCQTKFPERWPRRDKKFCGNACRQAAHRERIAKARETRNKPKAKKRRSGSRARK